MKVMLPLLKALAAFLVGLLLIGAWGGGWILGGLVGACLSLTVLDVIAWRLLRVDDPTETRRRAARVDPGQKLLWSVCILVGLLTIFSVIPLLSSHETLAPHWVMSLLCVWAAFGGWLLTHASFALRYAHMYYRDEPDPEGGLEFPGGQPPSDREFAYFAFTVGMSYAASDVQITCPSIRMVVLWHACVSFAFNTALLAFIVNLLLTRLQT